MENMAVVLIVGIASGLVSYFGVCAIMSYYQKKIKDETEKRYNEWCANRGK